MPAVCKVQPSAVALHQELLLGRLVELQRADVLELGRRTAAKYREDRKIPKTHQRRVKKK